VLPGHFLCTLVHLRKSKPFGFLFLHSFEIQEIKPGKGEVGWKFIKYLNISQKNVYKKRIGEEHGFFWVFRGLIGEKANLAILAKTKGHKLKQLVK
jgi:hypothetical protein